MVKHFSDQEIIDSILKNKDKETLRYVYAHIFPKIKGYVCANAGNEEEAFDIFQDAIMIFYKQVKNFKFKKDHEVGGFIYTVCRNLWINYCKRKQRQVSFGGTYESNIPEETNFDDDIITPEKKRMLDRIILKLGNRCFELLKYSVYLKKSNKDICDILGFLNENAVKTKKYKCKQKLLLMLEKHPHLNEIINE